MKILSAAELLMVWEQGYHKSLLERAVLLLSHACPEIGPEAVAHFSIGRRDAGLLQIRQNLFGSRLLNIADCPQCSEQVEWETTVHAIRLQEFQPVDETGIQPSIGAPGEFSLETGEYHIRFRLPDSNDISAVINGSPDTGSSDALVFRCILNSHHRLEVCSAEQLPRHVLDALARQMEKNDPQADIRMELVCPTCAYRWDVRFDIADYLWREVDRWAKGMFYTIHVLATAYGWAESDILAMSTMRRQLYLGMVRP